ncbi:MAG: YdcF family protein [Vicinamibacterales bacterium]
MDFGEIVKRWLVPGSTSLLFAGVVGGAALILAGPVTRGYGQLLIVGLALLYWVLSLPAVAAALIAGLGTRFGRIDASASAHGIRALVAIGNGSVHYTDGRQHVDYLARRSVYCAFEAARVFALLTPELVITTGGPPGPPPAKTEAELLRDLLVGFGVPATAIVVEGASTTTEQQVAHVLALLAKRHIDGPIAVITTTAHMTRVAALFAACGVAIVPSVTPELLYDDGRTGVGRWLPSMSSLIGSSSAMYEYLANLQRALLPGSARTS